FAICHSLSKGARTAQQEHEQEHEQEQEQERKQGAYSTYRFDPASTAAYRYPSLKKCPPACLNSKLPPKTSPIGKTQKICCSAVAFYPRSPVTDNYCNVTRRPPSFGLNLATLRPVISISTQPTKPIAAPSISRRRTSRSFCSSANNIRV